MRHITVLLCLAFLLAGNASGQTRDQKELVLDFEGNKIFRTQQLLDVADKCLAQQNQSRDRNDAGDLDYCLRKIRSFLFGKGYLRAKIGEPRRQETSNAIRVIVPIEEGALYRLGKVEIKGAELFTRQHLLEMLSLKTGDVATGEAILAWLDGKVKCSYADHGYIQFSYAADTYFRPGSDDGSDAVVDLSVEIDEGQRFTIRSINFEGNGSVPEDDLRRKMQVSTGDVFNKELFDDSLRRIDQTGQFEKIDVDKDVDYRSAEKSPRLDLTIHLRRKN